MLRRFFLLNYLLVLWLALGYLHGEHLSGSVPRLFAGTVLLSYSALYLVPAGAITWLVWRVAASWVTYLVAVLSGGLTLVLLSLDATVYDLYGFHFNAFVWNLLTTAGGIQSLGGGSGGYLLEGLRILGWFALQGLLMTVAWYWTRRRGVPPSRLPFRWFAVLLGLSLLVQAGIYGVSNLRSYGPVQALAPVWPFYQPVTFKGLARRLGFEISRGSGIRLKAVAAPLNYPLRPLIFQRPEQPLNIVWLVSESLRWDMLTPEIMPRLWAFSQRGYRATQHFSGGNGTRQGMFALFYGLYGSYWDSFLNARRQPVLFDVLKAEGYQFHMLTSAKFTYPEFDKTIFAGMDAQDLDQSASGRPWKRDQENVGRLLTFVEHRDPARPFMTFLFFESPHARYDFPDSSILRRPYLANLNLGAISRDSLAKEIGPLKNRYINAAHYVDTQLGRIFDALDAQDLLDSTIVVVTGDHGEEFMEHGRWGHNSQFSEQQLRTPMVLRIPGAGHGVVKRITSHLDIVPTVMPWLGVRNPAADYSLGLDLLHGSQRRYTVVSSMNEIGYIGERYKYAIPYRHTLIGGPRLSDRNDQPLAEEEAGFLTRHRGDLLEIIANSKKFRHSASN